MLYYIYLIPLLFLVILSIIDLKTFHLKKGYIPSIITTTAILVSFIFSLNTVTIIFSLILALLLFDMQLFDGEPDIKAFVFCGAVMPTIYYIIWFAAITSFLSIIYKFLMKKAKYKEIPFLPVLLVSYIGTISLTFI